MTPGSRTSRKGDAFELGQSPAREDSARPWPEVTLAFNQQGTGARHTASVDVGNLIQKCGLARANFIFPGFWASTTRKQSYTPGTANGRKLIKGKHAKERKKGKQAPNRNPNAKAKQANSGKSIFGSNAGSRDSLRVAAAHPFSCRSEVPCLRLHSCFTVYSFIKRNWNFPW
ncbi:hypothetical protein ZHAS_00006299 [Anopheles sinensis]|uniref:Uncharacterized protein n=1 Tax=Anopheles sinensis TaxID=74873 RepID=A0A084VLH1_ANOSI|nr:hypothetical protein ZHAS_00006299 [Anopheles sinensis]